MPVENQIWGTDELLHSRTAADLATAFWEVAETFRLVEQRHSKPIRSLQVLSSNVPNDGFEIVQRQRLEDYFEVH